MSQMRQNALYIHWPFCLAKCPYCDFNSHVRDRFDEAHWEGALLADLAYEAEQMDGPVGSVFFGGGTPSLMPPRLVENLICEAEKLFGFSHNVEITLEANPSSVEAGRFAEIAAAGVNRVSLGIQSFDDTALRMLGRLHSAAEAQAAIDIAQANFDRVSIDLIYARPGQTMTMWEEELARGLALGTEHVSLYQLTIEPGTRFATDVRRGALVPLDDDEAADLFHLTRSMTAAAGLPAYETSNHARPGAESRHNLAYWRYADYAGVGPGAHGRRRGSATERHKKPENYLKAVETTGSGLSMERDLSASEQATEALLMGLRLTEGVDLGELSARFKIDAGSMVDAKKVSFYTSQGLVRHAGERLMVTEAGAPLLNSLLAELVVVESEPA